MKNTTLFFVASALLLVSACNEGNGKSSEGVTTSDTVVTGLEGSRDQPGQLLNDVKPDTTSGQTDKVRSLGQQADSINASQSGSSADQQFVQDAEKGNTEEVALAKMAVQRSSNQELKSVAKELETHHTQALQELKTLVKKAAFSENATKAPSAGEFSSLNSKNGKSFDKAWCEFLIEKHKSTISQYEKALSATTNGDLKQWISKTLPKLRMHNDHLMALHGKL